MNKVELLAPAGDLERLKIALLYGADAVYIGWNLFSLRANATNFTIEEIKEGVSYAHSLNKKVYVTVNIVMHNKEIKLLLKYLKQLEEANVDAIIVSDPAIIKLASENTKLQIHLSTQQSTINYEAVEFFKKEGVSRIVLARECSKDDIKAIFADFTMRIRLQNYNLKFAYYYMRSMYFQYLIEIYKKGLGNNTNIFPIVIKEFPIPDISLEEQQRIVDEIQEEIDKQTSIKQQISSLRGEIDKIIEKAISISGA